MHILKGGKKKKKKKKQNSLLEIPIASYSIVCGLRTTTGMREGKKKKGNETHLCSTETGRGTEYKRHLQAGKR